VKPTVHSLCTFGCVAHVKQGNKRLAKLEDQSTPMVFIGYEHGSKAWRFYDPATDHVHVSRDTVFEEGRAWSWTEEDMGDGEPFRMDYMAAENTRVAADDMQWPDSPLVTPRANSPTGASPDNVVMPKRGSEPHTPTISEAPGAVRHVTLPTDTLDIDEETDGALLHFRSMGNLFGAAPPRGGIDTQLIE
jgi:hypothetical protein